MDLPNFNQFNDPWAHLDPNDLHVVVIRTTELPDGGCIIQLVNQPSEAEAVSIALSALPLRVVSLIKDVRAIALSELDSYSPREIQGIVKTLTGVE